MATNVVMPQMGESIAEGTIVRWIKKIGEAVDRDEPLFEISTDKVDAEIPSPGAGVLTEIRVKEGETVPVNSVVAVIGEAGAKPASSSPSQTRLPEAAVGQPEIKPAPASATTAADENGGSAASAREVDDNDSDEPASKDDLRRQKSSPLVRRIAREHDVDIQQINGTGISGRVTKSDILEFIKSGTAAPAPAAGTPRPIPQPGPSYRPGDRVEIVPMTVMRRKIAEHMVLSAHTSPHVYSVYEVNFTARAAA